jgi:CRISPR system Cascade subunit CasE
MYMTRVMLRNVPPPNIIHGILSAAFPDKRSDRANENLWRVDNLGDDRALIIVSANSPNRELITSKIGATKIQTDINNKNNEDKRKDKTLDYAPLLEQLESGQSWKFRLCANPVKHKKIPGVRGKICALNSVPQQLEWLDRQGTKYGFAVKGCSIIKDERQIFGKVHLRAVTFEGLLTITDSEVFYNALTKGIGRGKAYGCGLLTIARSQT